MSSEPENITIVDGITNPTPVDNGPHNVTIGSSDINVIIGDGPDTITAGNHDTIKVGNGVNTITIGDNDTLTVGSGQNTITAGMMDTITVGNGVNTITAGLMSKITAGNGQDNITAGPKSTIVVGNGNDVVHVGHDSSVTMGSGPDTVHAGTNDTLSFNPKSGLDTIDYDGLTPAFTVSAPPPMNEEQTVALPITILPPNLGNEVINGFKHQNGVIGFDTNDFANASAVFSNAAQVGSNVVITQPGGGGTVTLTNTSLSSLTAANFVFFAGSTDIVNITGLPSDAKLSAGTNNGGGSWTLTPAQLSGLTLTAGEPSGDLGTPDTVTVTITNPAGESAAASQSFPLVVNAIPPTVGVSVDPYQTGDSIDTTRLQITASPDDPDGSNDQINRVVLTGIPTGVTLTTSNGTPIPVSGGTAVLPGQGPGSFNEQVDVTTPAAQSTNFTMGIQAFSDEPNSPELSASTSQSINVEYEPQTFNPIFQVNDGNMWTSGSAFTLNKSNFIGVDYPNGYPGSGPAKASTSFLSTFKIGGSFGLKAGIQSDLTLNAGSYNATLPYNIGLANTFNKTNDTLEVDPNESQGTTTLSTASPQGSYSLNLILDALMRAFAGPISLGTTLNYTHNLFSFNSNTASKSFTVLNGIVSVTVAWPTLNLNGSGTGSDVSASGLSNPIADVKLDPIALIANIADDFAGDPFKGSGGFGVGLGGLHWTYTLAAGTVEPTINLGQAFDLNIGSLTPSLTDNGNPVPFSLTSPTIIPNAPGSNNFDLGLTPDASLSNDTSLASQLIFGIKLLAASGKITVGLTFIPGATTTVASGSVGPLFHTSYTINGPSVSIYQNTFPVAFGSKSENFTVS